MRKRFTFATRCDQSRHSLLFPLFLLLRCYKSRVSPSFLLLNSSPLPSPKYYSYYLFVFVDRPPQIRFHIKQSDHSKAGSTSASTSKSVAPAAVAYSKGLGKARVQKTYLYIEGSISKIDPSSYRLGRDPDIF